MAILKENLFGTSTIGVYLSLNNKFLLYPKTLAKEKVISLKSVLKKDFPIYPITINQSSLVGTFIVMNSYGLIAPSIINDKERDFFKKITKENDMNMCELKASDNAFGNLIMVNDKGAIISEELKTFIKSIQSTLDVEIMPLNYANSRFPGSAGVANNKGCCVHPLITEEEASLLAEILKVEVDVSTVNMGDPFVRSGAVVNDFVGFFGRNCSGPEMMRLTNVLKL
ncbi:MAG: translation initiation factor IF-6 [Promethearchaeota archaeon]